MCAFVARIINVVVGTNGPQSVGLGNKIRHHVYEQPLELGRGQNKMGGRNHKAERDTPTMEELSSYLGEWTNHIARLESLGISYKITPFSEMEPQFDDATLTREIYFHAGFCRYYPAGTRYCIHTGWSNPELSGTSNLRASYFANRELLAVAIFFLTAFNLAVLAAIKLFRRLRTR